MHRPGRPHRGWGAQREKPRREQPGLSALFPQVGNLQVAPLRFTEKSLRRDALNFLSPSRQADFPCTPSRGSPWRVCLCERDCHQLLPISFPPPPTPRSTASLSSLGPICPLQLLPHSPLGRRPDLLSPLPALCSTPGGTREGPLCTGHRARPDSPKVSSNPLVAGTELLSSQAELLMASPPPLTLRHFQRKVSRTIQTQSGRELLLSPATAIMAAEIRSLMMSLGGNVHAMTCQNVSSSRVGLFCLLLYPTIGPSLALSKSLRNAKGGDPCLPFLPGIRSPPHPCQACSEKIFESLLCSRLH